MRCDQCQIVYINGMRCHEIGCPEAWKDYIIDCPECGTSFVPEEKEQTFCCEDCWRSHSGLHEPLYEELP